MSEETGSAWMLFALLGSMMLCAIGMSMELYVASSKHYRVMLRSFKNSASLTFYLRLWGGRTLRARFWVVSAMAGLMVYHQYAVKRGILNAADVKAFPIKLRLMMQVSSWLLLVGVGVCTLLVIALARL
ncbi:hypothetical protein [Pseudomonas alabamensis]|uniref:hypothetical protein n=1 Tax=Pseudomonas alabamensis TaxID=3064349 RepID=UPI003F64B6CE